MEIVETAPVASVVESVTNKLNTEVSGVHKAEVTNQITDLTTNLAEHTSTNGLEATASAIVVGNTVEIHEDKVVIGNEEIAITEVLKEELGAATPQDVEIVVKPYLDIKIKDIGVQENSSNINEITFDIKPKAKVLATTQSNTNGVVLKEHDLEDSLNTPVDISIPLPTSLVENFRDKRVFVKHIHTNPDGSHVISYYPVTIENSNANFTTIGFSDFKFTADDRTALVSYSTSGTPSDVAESLDLRNVGKPLPVAEAAEGYRFTGYTFDGISGTYTTLNEDLLTSLSSLGTTVTAHAVFERISSGTPTGNNGSTVNHEIISGTDLSTIAANHNLVAKYNVPKTGDESTVWTFVGCILVAIVGMFYSLKKLKTL